MVKWQEQGTENPGLLISFPTLTLTCALESFISQPQFPLYNRDNIYLLTGGMEVLLFLEYINALLNVRHREDKAPASF